MIEYVDETYDILFYQCKGAFAGVITVLTEGGRGKIIPKFSFECGP